MGKASSRTGIVSVGKPPIRLKSSVIPEHKRRTNPGDSLPANYADQILLLEKLLASIKGLASDVGHAVAEGLEGKLQPVIINQVSSQDQGQKEIGSVAINESIVDFGIEDLGAIETGKNSGELTKKETKADDQLSSNIDRLKSLKKRG